jgi:hypothetical protein
LYVDDMLVAGTNMQDINVLKKKLANSFAMKDLGAAKKILGMRIRRDRKNRKLTLSQGEYTENVLERFRMQNAKPVSTPLASHFKLTKEMCPKTQEEIEYMSRVPYSSAVGSLMYAMVCTRPDIAYAVGVVSRYMNNPGKEHREAVKWILRYLRGTTTHALCFGGSDTFLQGYVDSDMAGDKDSRRSTTGYVFTIGGTTVSWISKLQKVVALSTTEAEYVAATEASKEMIWLQRFMEELGKKQKNNRLYCDSQSAIHLEISLQVGDCWLWSLIIFLIQRSLLSAVFIPHEVFTPQKYVHSSTWGSAEGGYPLCRVRGGYPPSWGVWGLPAGVRGRASPEAKIAL